MPEATTASSAGFSGTAAVTVKVCTVLEAIAEPARWVMATGQTSTFCPLIGCLAAPVPPKRQMKKYPRVPRIRVFQARSDTSSR